MRKFYPVRAVCLTWTLALGFSQLGWATPAQVLIIRHAEKPAQGNELSPKGQSRAQSLIGFFKPLAPVAIYAASPDKPGGSIRSIQTVEPTASALGLQLQTQFTASQVQELASVVLNSPELDGKVVLICWAHSQIPEIAAALGAEQAPSSWNGSVFDRVWRLDFKQGQVMSFLDLPQHVLPGDSKN